MTHSPVRSGFVALALTAAMAAPFSIPAQAQFASDYQRRLAIYTEARAAFDQEAKAYWTSISEKRRIRNAKRRDRVAIALDDYVLEHPPLYAGPKKPADPSAEPEEPRGRKPIPVVADFLQAAATHFSFVPQRPAREIDFKRAYARAATEAGLTREQAVRVYSFETGGNGGYDMQSGFTPGRPGGRAISTATGYNQLLTTNSVELVAEQGNHILKVLEAKAARLSGPARETMSRKIMTVKRMVAFARSVPDTWSDHEKLGATPQGWGVHALVLDIDVGPLLQVHKLLTSVEFARTRGFLRPLSAAELEMMNLTGDGTGFDMVTMPDAMRDSVPTSNFFQRMGYERNPVAIRHNTVAKLLAVTNARMDANSRLPGAQELAAAF